VIEAWRERFGNTNARILKRKNRLILPGDVSDEIATLVGSYDRQTLRANRGLVINSAGKGPLPSQQSRVYSHGKQVTGDTGMSGERFGALKLPTRPRAPEPKGKRCGMRRDPANALIFLRSVMRGARQMNCSKRCAALVSSAFWISATIP
jgi:hypothetical protein